MAAERTGICVAISCGKDVEATAGRTRVETIEFVEALAAPVVVGFDFSFGFPEWFALEHGCATIADVWALAGREGETWLRPAPPFWRDRCDVPPGRRFRMCELDLVPAKSIFQLVGDGQVGAGSVRGMPFLARLRANGFAIWPFDPPGDRTAVEIYPSRLRRLARGEADSTTGLHTNEMPSAPLVSCGTPASRSRTSPPRPIEQSGSKARYGCRPDGETVSAWL